MGDKKVVLPVFFNLEAELTRAHITKKELAASLGISPGSLSAKLKGKSNFTLPQMLKVQRRVSDAFGVLFTLDYLFKTYKEDM